MKYVITFLLMCIGTLGYTQDIIGEGIEVVEFNASFAPSKCEFLEELDECETFRIDIAKNAAAQKENKIVVVPTVIIFNDGEEVTRFQANIMMQLEATQEEVQNAIDEAIMTAF
jgi:hypothetical protein|tara:strand:- start:109 stop:450 length:342 start_codon:yes stop_codon:yes gene_type:complete